MDSWKMLQQEYDLRVKLQGERAAQRKRRQKMWDFATGVVAIAFFLFSLAFLGFVIYSAFNTYDPGSGMQ